MNFDIYLTNYLNIINKTTHKFSFRKYENTITDKLKVFNAFNLMAMSSDYDLWTYDDTVNKINARLQNKDNLYFLNIDSIDIGFVCFGKATPDSKQICIHDFAIFKQFQGSGYGKYFLRKIIELIKKIYHTTNIILAVSKSNERAQSLYKKCGFTFYTEGDQIYILKYLKNN